MPTLTRRRVTLRATGAVPAAAPALVLVVDADENRRTRRVRTIGMVGLRVTAARTGLEAIVKASCLLPDVIVIQADVNASGPLDGAATVELIRGCPSTAHIRIIEVAGNEAPANRTLLRAIRSRGIRTARATGRIRGSDRSACPPGPLHQSQTDGSPSRAD